MTKLLCSAGDENRDPVQEQGATGTPQGWRPAPAQAAQADQDCSGQALSSPQACSPTGVLRTQYNDAFSNSTLSYSLQGYIFENFPLKPSQRQACTAHGVPPTASLFGPPICCRVTVRLYALCAPRLQGLSSLRHLEAQ